MNYTRPEDENHEDDPREWLNTALIFTRALSLLLEEKEGIVVDIQGDAYNPVGDSRKVIVFRENEMLYIEDFEKNLVEGTLCTIIRDENSLN
jgi:hypothetical protein